MMMRFMIDEHLNERGWDRLLRICHFDSEPLWFDNY